MTSFALPVIPVSTSGKQLDSIHPMISVVCTHNPEKQLDLLIIGHNPSEHAWKSGNMYSNPTNRMWKILTGTLLASPKYPV